MEERKINEGTLVDLKMFDGVSRFRSIRRAMRRGHVTPWGRVAPDRPFNNRNRSRGTRPLEIEKERIYGQIKQGRKAG